jgi:hypothetical protein
MAAFLAHSLFQAEGRDFAHIGSRGGLSRVKQQQKTSPSLLYSSNLILLNYKSEKTPMCWPAQEESLTTPSSFQQWEEWKVKNLIITVFFILPL